MFLCEELEEPVKSQLLKHNILIEPFSSVCTCEHKGTLTILVGHTMNAELKQHMGILWACSQSSIHL